MWTLESHKKAVWNEALVSAVFFDDTSATDALADLKLAGFSPDQIAVAVPPTRRSSAPLEADGAGRPLTGKHSILWRLRHWNYHDTHDHGPVPTGDADDTGKAHDAEHAFTEVDLTKVLTRFNVAPTTVKLIEDRMGPEGYFIMVDAGERLDDVESILVRNRGMLRNVMAAEPSAEKLPADGRSTKHEQVP